jgi:D-sedoheptulose 7-phosphate isomerase
MTPLTIKGMIEENADVKKLCLKLAPAIEKAADLIEKALKNGNKVILAGNGGSASQATHIAAEFTGRYKLERKALPGISLSADLSAITAIANDYGYDNVFSRQLEGLGNKGDVFIALSTSGNSENVIKALNTAGKKKIQTISLIGKGGGRMKGMADIDLIIPSSNTPRIQECHLMILHIICEVVENSLFVKGGKQSS